MLEKKVIEICLPPGSSNETGIINLRSWYLHGTCLMVARGIDSKMKRTLGNVVVVSSAGN